MKSKMFSGKLHLFIPPNFFKVLPLLIVFAFCVACSNDEPSEPIIGHPSLRDGVFSGEQLTVKLNGELLSTVASVTLNSELFESYPQEDDGSGDILMNYVTFKSKIIIVGFPSPKKITQFETISDYVEFKGTTVIDGVTYEYQGEFTGSPLHRHENQGLILQFYTK